MELEVTGRTTIAKDVVELVLRRKDGGQLPEVSPGGHMLVHLPSDMSRQYSFCNGPIDRDFLKIAVKLDHSGRGGSAAMHRLAVGDIVLAELPPNAFGLLPATHTVLFAAGIGITPIVSMVQSLAAAQRPYTLFYSARDEDNAPYRELLQLAPFASNVHFHFSARDGRINAVDVLKNVPPEARLYTCGPADFMESVVAGARDLGWPADRLHREYFAAEINDQTGSEFKAVLARTGLELIVRSGESLLQACQRVGCDIPSSCEQGVCGTCMVTVLEGEPDHRDLYLNDAEKDSNKVMLACCSRARSAELVLDI